MSEFYPYRALYTPFGRARRNQPIEIEPMNPLEPNAMANDTGNAGCDGYTVLSRASRQTGERPIIGGTPQYEGPRLAEDL